jgi:hypothetical protein
MRERGRTISRGIQARTISGEASSDFSHMYFENRKWGLDAALEMAKRRKLRRACYVNSFRL